mgnify:CR=1 FL=1
MNFDQAFDYVIGKEGGETNDPDDNGGHTKFGISKKAFPDLDIASLTLEQAKQIYLREYWDKVRGDELPDGLGFLLFDCAVNQGTRTSVKFLQRALRVTDDGVIGPATIAAANKADTNELIVNFSAERALHYASLDDFKLYGRGWIRRLIHTARIA